MLRFIEVTGKTEEEAILKGLAQLGLERDDVSLEILERAKSGFLGIGSVPAKIKMSYEGPDEPAPVVEAPAPKKEEPKQAAPRQEQPKPAQPKREQPKREPPKKEQPKPQADPANAVPVDGSDEVAAAITAFQTGLFQHMGVQAVPQISRDGDTYLVVLQGEGLGALIGHRGETLDAIQQLTGYAVNRDRSNRVRVRVDAEDYRARREESLVRLARKTAERVIKMRRSVSLESMNAYERHVIHAALQDYPGVSTHSTGTEPNRRTVVTYDAAKQ